MEKLFPLSKVVNPATLNYNCHGFALAPRHLGWYNFPDFFISDDYVGTAMESPQPGDILIYGLEGVLTHSAVVIQVSGSDIVSVQSKWGGVAEVKHPPRAVPDVYGAPLVLLRPRPGFPKHPALSGDGNATAAGGGGAGEPASSSPASESGAAETSAAETVSPRAQLPERFMLMLASTPEVRRRILRTGPSKPGGGGSVPFNAPTPPIGGPEAAAAETLDASTDEGVQDDIKKALEELSARDTQFMLMLASTAEVLRAAASQLKPITDLIELSDTGPEARSAVVRAVIEFFEKPETQADEQIIGLTLFLMSKIPSKEAVVPIARYLATREFSLFNGGLAADALRASITMEPA